MGKKKKKGKPTFDFGRPGQYQAPDSKKDKKEDSNSDLQIKSNSGSKGLKTKSKFDAKKFAKRDAAFKSDMQARIKDAESYTPKPLKLSPKNAAPITSKNLPDRPTAPKMPTINLPNGSLITDKVANPSGLSGQSKRYSTKTLGKSDLKSAYSSARVDGAPDLKKFKKRVKG